MVNKDVKHLERCFLLVYNAEDKGDRAYIDVDRHAIVLTTEADAQRRGLVRAIFNYKNPETGVSELLPWEVGKERGWKMLKVFGHDPFETLRLWQEENGQAT